MYIDRKHNQKAETLQLIIYVCPNYMVYLVLTPEVWFKPRMCTLVMMV